MEYFLLTIAQASSLTGTRVKFPGNVRALGCFEDIRVFP